MHGRKKGPIDEKKKMEIRKKCQEIQKEYELVMEARKDPSKIEEVVKNHARLLEKLDDFATFWNMRKEYFKEHATNEQLEIELAVSKAVIYSNPKCYWAFHHRRWCYEYMNVQDVSQEIKQCDLLLDADCRNFHAWRHRRWAVLRCGNLYDKELEASQEFINKNPANGSAWHYRSQLPNLTNFKDEVEMTKAAMWTDPKDQSPWIYYRWLLSKPEIYEDQEFLQQEDRDLIELEEAEPDCKYPFLAHVWIQRKLSNGSNEKITELVNKLCEMDPIRSAYYKEL